MAKTVLTLEGDEAKAMLALTRVIQKQKEIARQGGRVRQETGRADRAGRRFSKSFSQGLGTIASKLVAIGASLVVFKKLVDYTHQFNRESRDAGVRLDVPGSADAVHAEAPGAVELQGTRRPEMRVVRSAGDDTG